MMTKLALFLALLPMPSTVAPPPTPAPVTNTYCVVGRAKAAEIIVTATDGPYKGVTAPLQVIHFECSVVVKIECTPLDGDACANAKWDGVIYETKR